MASYGNYVCVWLTMLTIMQKLQTSIYISPWNKDHDDFDISLVEEMRKLEQNLLEKQTFRVYSGKGSQFTLYFL